LSSSDFDIALRHTHEYLEKGGIFRLVLPDLECLARKYLSDPSPLAASRFMEGAHLGLKYRPRGVVARLRAWLGNSAHLWMWDERSLVAKLEEHGFVRIRRASPGDAEDVRFRDVEDPGRFNDSIALHCSK
jgi:predicted SAM-dependent methyltransferase